MLVENPAEKQSLGAKRRRWEVIRIRRGSCMEKRCAQFTHYYDQWKSLVPAELNIPFVLLER